MFKFEFRFMGDRRHPLMRLAFRLTRRFPLLKRLIAVEFWDGYSFCIRRVAS